METKELEKCIYELRGVAAIISNLDNANTTSNYSDNISCVLSSKLFEIADNLQKIDNN